MTEERSIEIIEAHGGYKSQVWVLQAMKKAVNEALDDAAENGTLLDPAMNIKCKSGHGFEVDKQSILNLKVK